jgi:hypothetical protein
VPPDMANFEESNRAGSDLLTELRLDVRYIKEALKDIKVKLDTTAAKDDFRAFKNETNICIERHDVEIASLKNFRYWILGAGAAVGVITHLILDIVLAHK